MDSNELKRKNDLRDILAQSIGSENYYMHLSGKVYTDGIQLVASTLGAYWLIDDIFRYNRKEVFQLWTLVVRKRRALLTMREDKGTPKLVSQKIDYTDFPEGKWKFYVADRVLMVPREY